MQLIRKLKAYPEIDQIFSLIREEDQAAFLDSSLQNELGRYSIIGRCPYLNVIQKEKLEVNGEIREESFEDYIKNYLKTHPVKAVDGLPVTDGAIGYFTYDYGRKKEGVQTHCSKEVDIPDAQLVFYDEFIIEDHEKKTMYLIANGHNEEAGEQMKQLVQLLREAEYLMEKRDPGEPVKDTGLIPGKLSANFTREDYKQAIDHVIRYIIEGDVYIANMTQQLQIKSRMHPYDMFQKLRLGNPSPFGGYFNYGDFQIVSASPERFLQMQEGLIQTRPIKGTRKRGSTTEEDEMLKQELADSGKDQSELLMIVDLERNDLNRVCIPGSVKVEELFTVETYATVFHLIANITGQLRPELTVMDLIEAAFPGGSITGAPKLRAMEIIDELEHSRRNLYTGSIGYISLDGSCDFNIVIRTAVVKDNVYYIGAGGGITCESETEFEYEETLQKAKALAEVLNCDVWDLKNRSEQQKLGEE